MKPIFRLSVTLCLLLLIQFSLHAQQGYITKSGTISFYSYTPIRDIKAVSTLAVGFINADTRQLKFQVSITSFVFENALMQEHFNENYMESDKKGYEFAVFDGTINESFDLTADGVYNVTVTGNFTCHNVTQKRTISGTLTVKGGQLILHSQFDVLLADHQIKKPQVVNADIADTIQVTVDATLQPYNPAR